MIPLLAALTEEIEALKKVVAELGAHEERYRDLFQNATIMIFTLDPQGAFTSINKRGEQVTGYAQEELLGRSIFQFLTPVAQEPIRRLMETRSSSEPLAPYEAGFLEKEGRWLDLELSCRLIRLRGDGPHEVQGIARDVSKRKQLQLQLSQAQKMEAIGRLAGGVAHDFNNHLGVIIGYSELLLDRLSPNDPLRKSVTKIQEAGQRSASLTRQLLAFSRRQALEPKVLDLNAAVSELDNMLRPLIGEDVELVTLLGPSLGRLRADPTQMDQIIMNLAVNARDAMPGGGRLVLQTSNAELDETYVDKHVTVKPGHYVMLAVSDNGTGMDRQTQEQIFEPFFTTKEKGRGTGLGLSMVYGIVQQSGGYICVYSELGKGTTFKIYLPRVDEVVPEASAEHAPGSDGTGQETVLVVEDDGMLRELSFEILRENGYTVLAAGTGEEAVDISRLHPGPIHLLMTDAVIPGTSGRELARHLEQHRPDMKVLLVSGYTDDSVLHNGLGEPGTAFLQKPFSRGALTRKVRAVLDGKGGAANGH